MQSNRWQWLKLLMLPSRGYSYKHKTFYRARAFSKNRLIVFMFDKNDQLKKYGKAVLRELMSRTSNF